MAVEILVDHEVVVITIVVITIVVITIVVITIVVIINVINVISVVVIVVVDLNRPVVEHDGQGLPEAHVEFVLVPLECLGDGIKSIVDGGILLAAAGLDRL